MSRLRIQTRTTRPAFVTSRASIHRMTLKGPQERRSPKRLRLHRVHVFEDDPNEAYGLGLGSSFAEAARRLGIVVDGPHFLR